MGGLYKEWVAQVLGGSVQRYQILRNHCSWCSKRSIFRNVMPQSELGFVRERAMIETVPESTSKIRSVLPVSSHSKEPSTHTWVLTNEEEWDRSPQSSRWKTIHSFSSSPLRCTYRFNVCSKLEMTLIRWITCTTYNLEIVSLVEEKAGGKVASLPQSKAACIVHRTVRR